MCHYARQKQKNLVPFRDGCYERPLYNVVVTAVPPRSTKAKKGFVPFLGVWMDGCYQRPLYNVAVTGVPPRSKKQKNHVPFRDGCYERPHYSVVVTAVPPRSTKAKKKTLSLFWMYGWMDAMGVPFITWL